jgi:hypothetical protein
MWDTIREVITDFAKACYRHESGTKKAVDKGIMTMEELEIYHYINAWVNHIMPYVAAGIEERDREFDSVYPAAYKAASRLFGIDEGKAEFLFKKIAGIPRVAP